MIQYSPVHIRLLYRYCPKAELHPSLAIRYRPAYSQDYSDRMKKYYSQEYLIQWTGGRPQR